MSAYHHFSNFFQAIPDIRGKRRFCRWMMSAFGLESQKDAVLHTKSGIFRLPNLKEAISFELFINGSYEKGLVDLLSTQIPPNGVFLDIGANIGSISISLAKRRKDVRIIAVEASPWIFDILSENVAMNEMANITLFNKAVYHTSGLHLSMFAPKEYFGKGSLKPVYTQDGEQVETMTIEDILRSAGSVMADFIKVDVEGFEKTVFEGLPLFPDAAQKPKIIFEYDASTERSAGFEPGDAQNVLLARGYRLQGLDHHFRKQGALENAVISTGYANILAT